MRLVEADERVGDELDELIPESERITQDGLYDVLNSIKESIDKMIEIKEARGEE